MRWLIVHPGPEFSVHDVFEGWREALDEAGEHVAVYNMSDRLTFYTSALMPTGRKDDNGNPQVRTALPRDQAVELAANGILSACYQFWPDVVLVISAFFTPPPMLEVMRARGHKVVVIHTEAPYEDPRQVAASAAADVTLVNDPVTISKYLDVCPAVAYSPHAYRPKLHHPRPDAKRFDLAFSGTGYESRIQFFEDMGLDGLRFGLAGNWIQLKTGSRLAKYLLHDVEDCYDNTATAELYGEAKCGINVYRREADADADAAGWAIGPREVEMAACGLWFLRDPRPEGDDLFPQLPVFHSAQEAGELLRWALPRDALRDRGAAAAREAIADRTFSSNARMLLRLLDRQPVTI